MINYIMNHPFSSVFGGAGGTLAKLGGVAATSEDLDEWSGAPLAAGFTGLALAGADFVPNVRQKVHDWLRKDPNVKEKLQFEEDFYNERQNNILKQKEFIQNQLDELEALRNNFRRNEMPNVIFAAFSPKQGIAVQGSFRDIEKIMGTASKELPDLLEEQFKALDESATINKKHLANFKDLYILSQKDIDKLTDEELETLTNTLSKLMKKGQRSSQTYNILERLEENAKRKASGSVLDEVLNESEDLRKLSKEDAKNILRILSNKFEAYNKAIEESLLGGYKNKKESLEGILQELGEKERVIKDNLAKAKENVLEEAKFKKLWPYGAAAMAGMGLLGHFFNPFD